MKKIFNLLLVFGLCFSLVGCENNDNSSNKKTTSTTQEENVEDGKETDVYATEDEFSEAYPVLSDTVYLKNLDFKDSLKSQGVLIQYEVGLKYQSAYEKDNNVNVTYVINDDISYRLVFDKTSFSLNGIDVTTTNGRENERAIAVGMIVILDDYESFDDEEIKSIGAALQSDETDIYRDKDDKYSISVTKSNDVCSYWITKNK